MTQLISRGLRKAPVKKTRAACRPTAATKNSADQWWICRMSRPPLTANEIYRVEA